MVHRTLRRLTFCIAAVTLLSGQSYTPRDLSDAFEQDVLIISAAERACYRFDIWLAETSPQQRRGLMFVRNLPAGTGMLFVYEAPGRRSMWMKNTYIPLDMLFIRRNGVISSIIENTEPLSLTSRSSREPVTYVLELGGGVTAALGISAGDRVYWSGLP